MTSPEILVQDTETDFCTLFDLDLGKNLATRGQKKNGTMVFFEKTSQTEFLLTKVPNHLCYFRVRRGGQPWRVITWSESFNELLPYLYLFYRHKRKDKNYERRHLLFNRIPEVENLWQTSYNGDEAKIEMLIEHYMTNIYGIK